MAFVNPPDTEIRSLLARPATVAVVGCSPNPARDSHRIALFLEDLGHRVVPVNPNAARILGKRSYAALRDIPHGIDWVDVFRRSEHVAMIVDEAIAVGAKAIWLQIGVIDPGAADRALAAGLTVVMDRCPAIEHHRLSR